MQTGKTPEPTRIPAAKPKVGLEPSYCCQSVLLLGMSLHHPVSCRLISVGKTACPSELPPLITDHE